MYSQSSFAIGTLKMQPHEIPLHYRLHLPRAETSGATITLAIADSIFLNRATNDILAILPYQPKSVV